MIVDNEEFYEQQKPLSLKDIRCLIVILRQVRFVRESAYCHLVENVIDYYFASSG